MSEKDQNRVIKFRAWDNDSKRFLSAYEWPIGHSGLWLEMDTGKMVHLESDGDNGIDQDYDRLKNVIIEQFTGIQDKNGKDIYEGDILREPAKDEWGKINYACFEVFFHDGDANSDYNIGYSMSRTHYHGSVCGGYIPSFKPKTVSKMEIIGTIYETPNLLNPQ